MQMLGKAADVMIVCFVGALNTAQSVGNGLASMALCVKLLSH